MNRIIQIGIFTAVGIAIIVGFSFYVNDHPYWYRRCNKVSIHVDDATGLRMKSPVKTLGLEIGYIQNVGLDGDRVLITVCVTAPVKLNSETKAYVKSLGFLGDRFLELKPVDLAPGANSFFSLVAPVAIKHLKPADPTPQAPPKDSSDPKNSTPAKPADEIKDKASSHIQPSDNPFSDEPEASENKGYEVPKQLDDDKDDAAAKPLLQKMIDLIFPSAYAEVAHAAGAASAASDEAPATLTADRESEVQDTLKKAGKLIDNLTLMVGDLRQITSQKEFKETVVNLNNAFKNLETLLRPNGKLVGNVNAALESMKNSMQQLEETMKKINNGQGTIGKFVNDPAVYDELKAAVKSVNLLLGKAGALHTFVDLSAWQIDAYQGAKARFQVKIEPNPTRYYLLGISNDPKGKFTHTITTTTFNNGPATVEDKTVNEEKGIKLTAMFGKYFGPFDLRVGFLEDSGAVGVGYWLDPARRFGVHTEIYKPSRSDPIMYRVYARAQIYSGLYAVGGVDDVHKYHNQMPYFWGVGLFFDDEDLRYLLAFK